MTTDLLIRPALKQDADTLTAISYSSKRFWNYPESYYEIWRDELTVTTHYIDKHQVYAVERDEQLIGYYSIVHIEEDVNISGIPLEKGYWLEHMFVLPQHIGNSIGTQMLQHLRQRCKSKKINRLHVLAEPNARYFYEKNGFTYIMEYPSTIEGRTTPFLTLYF